MKQSEAGGHLIVAVAWLIIIAVFDLVVITIDTFTAAVVTNIVKSAVVEATLGSWWWSADVVEPARLATGAGAVLELAAILYTSRTREQRERGASRAEPRCGHKSTHAESPSAGEEREQQHKPMRRQRLQVRCRAQPRVRPPPTRPDAPTTRRFIACFVPRRPADAYGRSKAPIGPPTRCAPNPARMQHGNHAAPTASAREGGSSSMRVCCLTSIGADSSCVNLQSRRKQRPFCETCKPAGQQRGRVGNARGRCEENTESTRGGAEVGGGLGDSR